MKPFLRSTALALGLLATIASAGSLSVSNSKGFDSNPIVDINGSLLTGADPVIVAIGTFASEPKTAAPNSGLTVFSDAYLNLLAEFTPYGAPASLAIPDIPLNLRGVFNFQDNELVTGTALAGKSVYIVIAKGADLASATQVAILKANELFQTDDDASPFPKLVGVGNALGTVTIIGSETRFTACATDLDPTPNAAYSLSAVIPPPEIVIEQPAGSNLAVGASTIDFGTVAPGATSEREFTIRNIGATDLNLTGTPKVEIDGTGANGFTVIANPDIQIPPGGATTFIVRFTPSLAEPMTAVLHIASNDADRSPFDIHLKGVRSPELAATFNSGADVALTIDGVDTRGLDLIFTLGFAPATGTSLTVINNTGTGPITGTLNNLADGGMIGADYNGRTYYFIADYSGGDGNDLTLSAWNPASSSILVSDDVSASVLRYDLSTNTRKTFIPPSAFIGRPQGMAIGPDGNLYIVDTDFTEAKSRILKFDSLSGKNLGTFVGTETGISRGEFMTFDSAGNVYVQQHFAPLVVKFLPDGTPARTLFDTRVALIATGIGMGPDDRVYLAIGDGESGMADIIRCGTNGTFVDTFINDLGNFNGYRKPIWDSLGHIYAANLNDGLIQKFDAIDGGLLSTLDPPAKGYAGLCLIPNGALVVGDVWNDKIYQLSRDGNDLGTFASDVSANDIIQQPLPSVHPEITVEHPIGIELSDGMASVSFGTQVVGGNGAPVVFTVRNRDYGQLRDLAVTITGPAVGDFSINASGLPPSLATDESASFSVTFAPVADGLLGATLHVSSNDADEAPYDINLTGLALSFMTDADLDGLNDAAEWKMADLGFDWLKPQPDLVGTLFGNATGAGLFTRAALDAELAAARSQILDNPNTYSLYTQQQLQALRPETPLISRDQTTGKFTVLLNWKKSTDLTNFVDFPVDPAGVSVNSEGDIEFKFTCPDNAAFFRLEEK